MSAHTLRRQSNKGSTSPLGKLRSSRTSESLFVLNLESSMSCRPGAARERAVHFTPDCALCARLSLALIALNSDILSFFRVAGPQRK